MGWLHAILQRRRWWAWPESGGSFRKILLHMQSYGYNFTVLILLHMQVWFFFFCWCQILLHMQSNDYNNSGRVKRISGENSARVSKKDPLEEDDVRQRSTKKVKTKEKEGGALMVLGDDNVEVEGRHLLSGSYKGSLLSSGNECEEDQGFLMEMQEEELLENRVYNAEQEEDHT
ncbi:hypothetical protein E2542_SST15589 [Spatholobus suberectus]|nr:hypothetical protein E2542_SST15589 [Spatholobus suberectus]